MELNITRFFNEAACDDSEDYMILDDEEKREAFRAHVKGFGDWTDEEIAAWSDRELNALLLQMISGDIRESNLPDNIGQIKWSLAWEEYYEQIGAGQVSGRLFEVNGEVFYSID